MRRISGSADVGAITGRPSLRWPARWPYRIAQFLRGFGTAVDPDEARAISRLLSEAELQLFLSMRPRDRRHAVETMHHASRIAADHNAVPGDALLIAALLHDVGKGQLRIEDRVLYVILRAMSPRVLDRCAATEGARWRRALWQLRHHATVGAAQLEAIGSAPWVVELTAVHHEDPPASADPELQWLLAADELA